MTINIPNPGGYFQQIGNDVVALRVALNDLIRDAKYINAVGGAAFFQAAPFNLSAADAQQLASVIGAVVPTNPTVIAVQAFLDSAETLTGGS